MIKDIVRKIAHSKPLGLDEAVSRLRAYVADAGIRKERIGKLQSDLDQLLNVEGDAVADGNEEAISRVTTLEGELALLRRAESLSHERARVAAVIVGNRAGEIERECRRLMQANLDAARVAVSARIAPWFSVDQRAFVASYSEAVSTASRDWESGCPSAVGITPTGEQLHPSVNPAEVLAAFDGVTRALDRAKAQATVISAI